jgi:hypothetical protein
MYSEHQVNRYRLYLNSPLESGKKTKIFLGVKLVKIQSNFGNIEELKLR